MYAHSFLQVTSLKDIFRKGDWSSQCCAVKFCFKGVVVLMVTGLYIKCSFDKLINCFGQAACGSSLFFCSLK